MKSWHDSPIKWVTRYSMRSQMTKRIIPTCCFDVTPSFLSQQHVPCFFLHVHVPQKQYVHHHTHSSSPFTTTTPQADGSQYYTIHTLTFLQLCTYKLALFIGCGNLTWYPLTCTIWNTGSITFSKGFCTISKSFLSDNHSNNEFSIHRPSSFYIFQ